MKRMITLLMALYLVTLCGQSDYEKWAQQQSQEMQRYMSEQDAAFTDFLEKEWTAFQASTGKKRFEQPKPVTPPEVEPAPEPDFPDEIAIDSIPLPQPDKEIKPLIVAPVQDASGNVRMRSFLDREDVPEIEEQAVTIDFYGISTAVRIDKDKLASAVHSAGKDAIAGFWKDSAAGIDGTPLEDAQAIRSSLELNDWAYILYLKSLGNKLYPDSPNSVALLTWMFLIKSGYKIKIGYDGDSVFLMIPCDQSLYGLSYIEMDGFTYYAVTFTAHEPEEIYTYQGEYPAAERLIDLRLERAPEFTDTVGQRELRFNCDGREIAIPVAYNESAIAFYRDYPATDLAVYFDTPLTVESEQSIVSKLKPLLEGKSEGEALNLLLHFVQTAFAYKTDQDQFGIEKSFFPDEAFHYPYCDCEDRSVLFARLVRNLLGRKVIGLNYPGHIATAVRLESEIPGDSIDYMGERYLVCDPTYINANIGSAMPEFRDVQPKVIALN